MGTSLTISHGFFDVIFDVPEVLHISLFFDSEKVFTSNIIIELDVVFPFSK